MWYFQNIAPPSYMKYGESLCTTSASDLASTNANSVQECANICSEDHECVSFAYPTTINDSTECRLSSTCHEYNNMSDDIGWNTYVKRDEDDDVDEDVCPFLPFAQAEVCSLCLMYVSIMMFNITDVSSHTLFFRFISYFLLGILCRCWWSIMY